MLLGFVLVLFRPRRGQQQPLSLGAVAKDLLLIKIPCLSAQKQKSLSCALGWVLHALRNDREHWEQLSVRWWEAVAGEIGVMLSCAQRKVETLVCGVRALPYFH